MCAAPVLSRPTEEQAPSGRDTARTIWDQLVGIWWHLDLPEGWRAEIIEERIVMTPPPSYGHNLIASRVHRALVQVVPDEWEVFQTAGVSVPDRSNLFIPDLLVVPREEIPDDADGALMSVEKALLTVEITSRSNAATDRNEKFQSYASAGVPLYLLIDRFHDSGAWVSLYSKPTGEVYRDIHHEPFGEKITLPDPFDLTLDTSEF